MESFGGKVVAVPNKECKGMTSTITNGVYVSERDMGKFVNHKWTSEDGTQKLH